MKQYKKQFLTGVIILLLLIISCRKPTAPSDHDTGILWTKTYGGAYDDYGYSVQQTPDGGYIITGLSAIISSLDSDLYIIKTDENGDTMWTRNYGQVHYYEAGLSIQETNDGGYIIAGTTDFVFPSFPGDVYLIKTDINGDTLWTKVFEFGDYGDCVQQTDDGGYIIAGASSMYYQTNKMDVLLIKTDENGNTLWTKTYGGEKSEEGKSVKQTSDGGYIVVGTIYNTCECTYLIKTNPNGDTLWTRIYDGGTGYSVLQTSDGGYIIAGNTKFNSTSGNDIMILKTDSDGNILWTSTWGGANYDAGFSIIETTDGAYIIVGTTGLFGSGGYDVYLVKIRQ